MYWYIKVINQFSDFSGRARRKEFWMFVLFNMTFALCAMLLDNFLGTTIQIAGEDAGYGLIYIIYSLFVLIPNLALSVRRMHDVGKSGWFLLIAFIPIIGAIWLLVLDCTDGEKGTNKWGPNPKE